VLESRRQLQKRTAKGPDEVIGIPKYLQLHEALLLLEALCKLACAHPDSARSVMLTPGDTIRATIGLKKGRSQWQRK
jgi:hypothetical protein